MAEQKKTIQKSTTGSSGNETETIIEEYVSPDGTKMVKKTIIKRTQVSSSSGGGGAPISGDLAAKFKTMSMDVKKTKKDINIKEWEQKVLKDHNDYRAKHGVQPLELSREICNFAQEWADKLASTGQMAHRTNNKYGENLFNGYNIDPAECSKMWYDEIKSYGNYFGKEPPRNGLMSYGHFTQLIWKNSRKLGVALAYLKDNSLVVVANYDPPGNVIGTYASNVLAPK